MWRISCSVHFSKESCHLIWSWCMQNLAMRNVFSRQERQRQKTTNQGFTSSSSLYASVRPILRTHLITDGLGTVKPASRYKHATSKTLQALQQRLLLRSRQRLLGWVGNQAANDEVSSTQLTVWVTGQSTTGKPLLIAATRVKCIILFTWIGWHDFYGNGCTPAVSTANSHSEKCISEQENHTARALWIKRWDTVTLIMVYRWLSILAAVSIRVFHSRILNSLLPFSFSTSPIYTIIKQNWIQFLFVVKVTALKQQMPKFSPQIQRKDASIHIYISQRPVINVKASFCS